VKTEPEPSNQAEGEEPLMVQRRRHSGVSVAKRREFEGLARRFSGVGTAASASPRRDEKEIV